MNGPHRKPVSGYLWAGLAVLSCPCHLPIVAAVLAGTTAGGLLGKHWGLAALGLTGLFVVSLAQAMRAPKRRSLRLPSPTNGQSHN